MSRNEIIKPDPGKTELTNREWQILNKYCEPGSALWRAQLELIDDLRSKYPEGSLAHGELNVFDSRTGVADRITSMANIALELHRQGKTMEAEAMMARLIELGDEPGG